MPGPLEGIRIIELAGIGPAPFCGMMLADHGAEVVTVHRPGAAPLPRDPLNRSRLYFEANLKLAADLEKVKNLIASADGLIEGFRPGVLERLGLGPETLHKDNAKLVIGRMTGWGQTGPLAHAAGHDINYISLSGALHAFGRKSEKPTPPINTVGDFGGGGMLLAFAMCAALLKAEKTGKGEVIDCAMTEGSSLLMSMVWGFMDYAGWKDERGVNLLDTGAHFYDTYETSDGKYISLGSIEPQFYNEMLELTGLIDDPEFKLQMDPRKWPSLKDRISEVIKTKTRDEWDILMEGTDVCYAPVLSMAEAPNHPHNMARDAFIAVEGVKQPSPAPKYAHSPLEHPRKPKPFST